MALNPTLIQGNEYLFPANKGSEFTYLRRSDVKLKLYLPDRTIKEDGMIFLTSIRLVFVKNEQSKTNINFAGVELPLNLIEKPKFEQPVFGLNYLSGMIKPLIDHPNSLKSTCKWNLVFLNGQCSSFLNYFFKVYEASKANKPLGTLSEFNEQFFSNSNAYVDPNDPTFLYINEPLPEHIYKPQNISHNHYMCVNATNNSSMIPPLNNQNEDAPVYKQPYIPHNNLQNGMIPYNQQNYLTRYDPPNNIMPYSQPNYIPTTYDQQGNMNDFNQQNNNLPSYEQHNNNLSHYNNQDNRMIYGQQNNVPIYNQQNNLLNYDQRNNRNPYNQHTNLSNTNAYNQQNNRNQCTQRMNHPHNHPNNQQFNPAYNQHFNSMYNHPCSIPPYSQPYSQPYDQQPNDHMNQPNDSLYNLPYNQAYNKQK